MTPHPGAQVTPPETTVRYEPMTVAELRQHHAACGWRLFVGDREVQSRWWTDPGCGAQYQMDDLARAMANEWAALRQTRGEPSEFTEKQYQAADEALAAVAQSCREPGGHCLLAPDMADYAHLALTAMLHHDCPTMPATREAKREALREYATSMVGVEWVRDAMLSYADRMYAPAPSAAPSVTLSDGSTIWYDATNAPRVWLKSFPKLESFDEASESWLKLLESSHTGADFDAVKALASQVRQEGR